MNYSEAIQFLYGLRWFGAKLGLDNTHKLADLSGNPQRQLRFIHVAGTNGKGSTCAMLESIYRAAGLRVGLFTSPHLVAFSERIQVNRQPISEPDVARLVAEMECLLRQEWHTSSAASQAAGAGQPIAAGLTPSPLPDAGEHPTFFEVVTALALRYFAEQKCDLVIWETGLGGRLDATNIVTPLASVITNIQYDHQKWLGETLASIASEKAGIIKPGVPVITGAETPEALAVIRQTAQQQRSALTIVPAAAVSHPPLDTIQLPLLGQHQRMNAAVAVATVQALADQIAVGERTIRAGLAGVHWPGRLQLIGPSQGDSRTILLDGAHNVGGAEILAQALEEFFPRVKPVMVLGILRDKDWPAMCQILSPRAQRIMLVPVHSERTAEPHGLAEVCRQANAAAEVQEFPSLAAALAETSQLPFLVIAGSLYLIGEAMELLHLSPGSAAGERDLNEWGGPIKPSGQQLP
jgi:dihydrofolate synthase / folylpolyglutamate synthase